MRDYDDFHPERRAEWRDWLRKNHKQSPGIWLVYFKACRADRENGSEESARRLRQGVRFVSFLRAAVDPALVSSRKGHLPITQYRLMLLMGPRASSLAMVARSRDSQTALVAFPSCSYCEDPDIEDDARVHRALLRREAIRGEHPCSGEQHG